MQTLVTVLKPGHYVFGLRDKFVPGGTAPVGTYTYSYDARTNFTGSHDQALIQTGAITVVYGEPAKAVVAPAPVAPPAAPPVVAAPVIEDEPVVIEDIEKPVVVQVTKAAPKSK